MGFLDLFKPYSPEIRGNLEDYLLEHNGVISGADNLFLGPKYFFILKDKGLIVPVTTWVRVDLSPAPDISYFVNRDFMLESQGRGIINMSCVGAEKGVYDPKKALRRKAWSITGLDLGKLRG